MQSLRSLDPDVPYFITGPPLQFAWTLQSACMLSGTLAQITCGGLSGILSS